MNRLKNLIIGDDHRGAIEALIGFLASSALLLFVLWLVIFAGQVL